MAYTNGSGQTRVGVRIVPQVNASSLWNSIYSVYNADAIGSSSLKTSLVSAYNGESNTNDSFGTNNGTAQGGLTYTTGKIGNAFSFNGTNAYVSLPDNSLNFTGDFSISLWVNLASLSGGQFLFNNFKQVGLTNYYGYTLFAWNNYIYFRIHNGSLNNYDTITPFSSTNSWSNIVITRKTSVTNKIYINGVLAVSGGAVNPVYDSVMPYSRIGSYNDSNGYRFLANGSKLDAVTVWQKELTASEVSELYNSGNGAQYIGDNFYRPTTGDGLYNNNGTAQGGLTYGLGKVGTAFQFNGTNAYVSLPDNSLNLTGPYSISMWVYFESNPSSITPYILHSFNGTTNTGFEYRIRAGKPEIGLATTGGLYTYWYASNELFNTSGWYHLILVKPLNQQPQFYVNGVSTLTGIRVSNATVTEVTYTNPVKCSIGNNVTYLSNYMPNGSKIDALNIWNKVLTQSEITELYNSGNGKQYVNTNIITNGLILNLDASNTSSYSGTGTTWTNLIGGNYNATLYNGVSYTSTNSGGLTFDGVNDYVLLNSANKPSTTLANSGFSFGIWFSLNGWSSGKGILQIAYPNSLTSTTPTFLINTLNTNQIQYYIGSAGWTGNTTLTNKNAPQYFTFTISSNSSNVTILKVFINGVYQFMVNNPFDLNTFNNRDIYIGNGYNGCMSLNCYSVHMYNNKTLTDAEVLQNYINTKSRFGL